MDLGAFERMQTAVQLVRYRARTRVVQALTGVQAGAIRSLYREIHGRSPPAGLMKTSSEGLLRSSDAHLQASVAARLFVSVSHGLDRVDARAVLAAYELYEGLAVGEGEALDINDLWIIARDLTASLARFDWCQSCNVDYLVVVDHKRPGCPLCAKKRRWHCACGKRIRRGHRVCDECVATHSRQRRVKKQTLLDGNYLYCP